MPQILFPPTGKFSLSADTIHLRAVSLENAEAREAAFIHLLSSDEREKASRFHFGTHRARYTIAHGTLRTLLGHYLQTPPEQLQFLYGEHGKPELAGSNEVQLYFNLAHSDELAIYAFALGRKIGVDVEAFHPLPDLFEVAALYFSKTEIATLENLPHEEQAEAFFNCWTRKEAYLKAHGGGINDRLREITVTLKPDEPAQLANVAYDDTEVQKWEMAAFSPATGYIGAVAVERTTTAWKLQKSQFVY